MKIFSVKRWFEKDGNIAKWKQGQNVASLQLINLVWVCFLNTDGKSKWTLCSVFHPQPKQDMRVLPFRKKDWL